ncbi:8101_t:CDS:2 [Ambispora leptoticha]|uniref:8101_t:CDS:1 n=1 Tax=Ambispora leptoticha TaxID=144679 RepID=A0A9N8YVL7_9GLOM|nr:8101_t:CDS:2 [Ambispora leptoticha]
MTDFYSDETSHQQEFHEIISELFKEGVEIEIGTGKCDLTIQAAASYAKFYAQNTNKKLLEWSVYVEKPPNKP